MQSPPETRLATSLRDELATLRSFVALLQQEQDSLGAGKIEQVIALVADKSRLADQLARHSDERCKMLQALALTPDAKGMEQWLQKSVIPPTPPTSPAPTPPRMWAEILTLAAQARDLNALNGKLIAIHFQHNQQALNTLLAASNQASSLYGPDGQTHARMGKRLFGAA